MPLHFKHWLRLRIAYGGYGELSAVTAPNSASVIARMLCYILCAEDNGPSPMPDEVVLESLNGQFAADVADYEPSFFIASTEDAHALAALHVALLRASITCEARDDVPQTTFTEALERRYMHMLAARGQFPPMWSRPSFHKHVQCVLSQTLQGDDV